MPEDKYINTVTDVNTTATTISIFVEYVPSTEWILATGFWNNDGVWDNTANWQTP